MAKKKIYDPVKQIYCERCGKVTTHSVYDLQNRLYRCNICGNIHSPKKPKV